VGQIGEPVRRYTVVPLEEPVSPTHEPVAPPPPEKSPITAPPVRKPEPEPCGKAGGWFPWPSSRLLRTKITTSLRAP
jgi:hypothetical protein